MRTATNDSRRTWISCSTSPRNVLGAFRALSPLGYRSLLPVTGEQFADPEQRREWIEQKNLQVLSLTSDLHPDTTLDAIRTTPSTCDRFKTSLGEMTGHPEDASWEAATWEGSRRAQLRRSLRLSVRERLEALEAMAEVSRRLARLRGELSMGTGAKRDPL